MSKGGLDSAAFDRSQSANDKILNHSEARTKGAQEVELRQNVSSLEGKDKIPSFMKSTFRKFRRSGQTYEVMGKNDRQENLKKLDVESVIKSLFQGINNMKACEICELSFTKPQDPQPMCGCEHTSNFCESCLHHYAIYKIKSFNQVPCPKKGCSSPLNIKSEFFKQLPADIQRTHHLYLKQMKAMKNPHIKLCPKATCKTSLTAFQNFTGCPTCETKYCSKCLILFHTGECEEQQILFLEANLHYRQCPIDKLITERIQGGNLMICKCSNQLCYVCGAKWKPSHQGDHDENGNLIPPAIAPKDNLPECFGPQCKDCLNNCCCGLFKILFKILLVILYISFMILLMVLCLLLIILLTIASIIGGLFVYPFVVLNNASGITCILGIIFFPLLMIWGVGLGIQKVFCEHVPQLLTLFFKQFSNHLGLIVDM